MAYATIDDVESAWREVAPFERARFGQALDDAALWLDGQLEASGRDPRDVKPEVMRMLSVNLVRRAVGELDPTGAESSWTTYTDQTAQYSVPAQGGSDFWLTRWERSLLGVGRGRAGFGA